MPIQTEDILKSTQQQKAEEPRDQGTLTGLYDLVHVTLETSRKYCHSFIPMVQQVRSFHDKVAGQFAEMVWPRYSNPTVPDRLGL